jgi:hypothetical protein
MLKEEIYNLIDTIENILEANKIDMKNLKKKQKMINKLCKEPEYVDIERLVEEENKIISSIELLKDEQVKLKKVLYRQKVSLDILLNKDNNE